MRTFTTPRFLFIAFACNAAVGLVASRRQGGQAVETTGGTLIRRSKNDKDIKTISRRTDDKSDGGQDKHRRHRRRLQTCGEIRSGTATAEINCENVCGVSGLDFRTRKLGSNCRFDSDDNPGALDEARALGCPNVGGSFDCNFDDIRSEVNDGNLDIMCDFCTTGASCTEDTRLVKIWTCTNVCGVSGLEFSAEDTLQSCDFDGKNNQAEEEAMSLGCRAVGQSFPCPGFYGGIEREVNAGNLDFMCDFCEFYGVDTTPVPQSPPTLPPTTTPQSAPSLAPTPLPSPAPVPCFPQESALRECSEEPLDCVECVEAIFSLRASGTCFFQEAIVCSQVVNPCKIEECGPCDDEVEAFGDCAWRNNPNAIAAGCGSLACRSNESFPPTSAPVPPPTSPPTEQPTLVPVQPPTSQPTDQPTLAPVQSPTERPTLAPVQQPMDPATDQPTLAPVQFPMNPATDQPTLAPVPAPPTSPPTERPSTNPSAPVSVPPTLIVVDTDLPTTGGASSSGVSFLKVWPGVFSVVAIMAIAYI